MPLGNLFYPAPGCTGIDFPDRSKFSVDQLFQSPNKIQSEHCGLFGLLRWSRKYDPLYLLATTQMQLRCSCRRSIHWFADTNPTQIPAATGLVLSHRQEMALEISKGLLCVLCPSIWG